MVMTVEEKKAYNKAYREANKVKAQAYHKAYREANKEKLATNRKAYYEANKVKVQAYNKAYLEANKEKNVIACAKNYAKNKAARLEYQEVYRVKNSAQRNANGSRYRSQKFRATVPMTKEESLKIDELYFIAKEATKLFGYDWDVDHVVPLTKGGLHTLNNLEVVPASWNRSKGNRHSDSFWG